MFRQRKKNVYIENGKYWNLFQSRFVERVVWNVFGRRQFDCMHSNKKVSKYKKEEEKNTKMLGNQQFYFRLGSYRDILQFVSFQYECGCHFFDWIYAANYFVRVFMSGGIFSGHQFLCWQKLATVSDSSTYSNFSIFYVKYLTENCTQKVLSKVIKVNYIAWKTLLFHFISYY